MRSLALPLLAALLACACRATAVESAPIESAPVEDAHFVAEDGSYALELPLGWQRSEHALTHDGWDAQTITFNAGAVLDPGTSPIDASAPQLLTAMRDQLEAQPDIELIECRAATLDGLPGFRMHFRQTTPREGAASPDAARAGSEVVIYCAIEGATLYAFSLENRSPETFARDLEALERLVASFKRRAPAGS